MIDEGLLEYFVTNIEQSNVHNNQETVNRGFTKKPTRECGPALESLRLIYQMSYKAQILGNRV
jgi:hypothetical protein